MNYSESRRIGGLLILLLWLFFENLTCFSQQEFWDDDELEEERSPGLVAEFVIGSNQHRRIDPDLLWVGAIAASSTHESTDSWKDSWKPDSRLPQQPFQAVWSGQLNVREAGNYSFHFYGSGRFELTLSGESILSSESQSRQWHTSDAVKLPFGFSDIRVKYASETGAPSIGLYWQGPGFGIEPITERYFSHTSNDESSSLLSDGRMLSRALRCSACHEFPRDEPALRAPSLMHLSGNLRPQWLVDYLMDQHQPLADGQAFEDRRMPYYKMTAQQAREIANTLLLASAETDHAEGSSESSDFDSQSSNRSSNRESLKASEGNAQEGKKTFVSNGCTACHRVDTLGDLLAGGLQAEEENQISSSWFSGGDLSRLHEKRPKEAIARWLENPKLVNPSHRMPHFDLSQQQRKSLVDWFLSMKELTSGERNPDLPASSESSAGPVEIESGQQLIARFQCSACHEMPQAMARHQTNKLVIDEDNSWSDGCLGSDVNSSAMLPYPLTEYQIKALKTYLTQQTNFGEDFRHPDQILAENNCIGCHRLGSQPGIAEQFPLLSSNHPDLAEQLPQMTAPALDSVGDKMHRHSLEGTIRQPPRPSRRPWLEIQMPRFALADEELERLVDYFISHDRIPDHDLSMTDMSDTPDASDTSNMPTSNELTDETAIADQAFWLAAGRLVTSDGFSCQACHAIGDSQPVGVAPNAHGTDLTLLGSHIRESWFYRWVRNPARIVPRMEMPAIQSAIPGLLNDSLDLQLRALWLTLNRPDFQPPKANPVRVVRNYHQPDKQEYTHVLTDVLEAPELFIRPLILGLTNRHNWVIDLEKGSLAKWWLGDVARQHTRGKSWYWEPGAESLLTSDSIEQWSIVDSSGQLWRPAPPKDRQFAWLLDSVQHQPPGVQWTGRLGFLSPDGQQYQWLKITESWQPKDAQTTAVKRTIEGLEAGQSIRVQWQGRAQRSQANQWQIAFEGNHHARIDAGPSVTIEPAGEDAVRLIPESEGQPLRWRSEYRSAIPADRVTVPQITPVTSPVIALDIVPGFDAVQLPLPRSEMPITFAWDHQDRMFIGSLKGQVFEVIDQSGDGLQDTYRVISDEFPAPYGLMAIEDGLDVLTKFGLVRLTSSGAGSPVRDWTVIADGWGHTEDYHDWAVGLERDTDGNYFMTLPCQQDDRSEAAARWRGHALKLVPKPTDDGNRLYELHSFSAGLRFPMGLALHPDGELFATDNQGHYTPFNELNHLQPGKRYGFLNKLERKPGYSPPFESPSINLPHPWTRSVNGICFLITPESVKQQAGGDWFGPFEGHLIGCEMNGRSLIRMSLQRVEGQYQGAAYLFSRPPEEGEATFEGPIACQVSPDGSLYVGNLHDSGWGGGNNTGSIVRLQPSGKWPLGIAEVRANPKGLEIEFTDSVDEDLARVKQNYSIRSYIRFPTTAYGGEDQEEQREVIREVSLSPDRRTVHLGLDTLREGAVYELTLAPIGPDSSELFPSQAHYTMRRIPK